MQILKYCSSKGVELHFKGVRISFYEDEHVLKGLINGLIFGIQLLGILGISCVGELGFR